MSERRPFNALALAIYRCIHHPTDNESWRRLDKAVSALEAERDSLKKRISDLEEKAAP